MGLSFKRNAGNKQTKVINAKENKVISNEDISRIHADNGFIIQPLIGIPVVTSPTAKSLLLLNHLWTIATAGI